MGSDLARLVHLQDADDLPPFRNVSPGPPNSLPSLAQLGCSISPSGPPPSWTAVNHLHPSSPSLDTGSIADRAHHTDHDHHDHNVASSECITSQLQNHHSPLRPNSTSHLGRRIHHPNLAPKKPNASSRQDSVNPESPSPKVPSEASPGAPHVLLSKATEFVSPSSTVVTPLVPEPVLDSSLGPAHPSRAAIHALTQPQSIPNTLHQPYHPVSSTTPHNYQFPAPQHSSLGSGQLPTKSTNRTRRKPRPSHPRQLSISAPTASPLSKPAARSRRRAASNRSVEHLDPRTVANSQPPNSMSHVMPPPSLSPRNGSVPVSSHSETPASPSSPPVSDLQRSVPPSTRAPHESNATLSIAALSNGHVTHDTSEDSFSEAPSLRANQSPSPADADPPSPENETAADRGLRCRVCSVVYEPLSMERAHEEWRKTPGQSQATLSDMIRDFPQVQKSHYGNWIEQHQHDGTLKRNNLPARQIYANSHSSTLHNNKRKRPADEDHPPNARQTHYATKDSSGDTVWYPEAIARIFGVDGAPREPYVPAPNDDTNIWVEFGRTDENPHDDKEAHDRNKRSSTTPSALEASQVSPGPTENDSESVASPLPSRKPGVAPLANIMD